MMKALIILAVCSWASASVINPFEGEKSKVDGFYDLCDEDGAKCVGATGKRTDGGCLTNRTCVAGAVVTKNDDGFLFSMWTDNYQYISLGFSSDQDMGTDSVVSCRSDGNNVTLELSMNNGKRNELLESNENATLVESGIEDTTIYCVFTLKDTLAFANLAVELYGEETDDDETSEDDEFYALVAGGKLESDGRLGHHPAYFYSDKKWSFKSGAASLTSSLVMLILTFFIVKY